MKNLYYLIFVLFFFSCEKNEMLSENDFSGGNSSLLTRSSSSDIYVEDGYLVVKNFEVLDSISYLVGQMTDFERAAWENKMGFESAYSFYKPYFEAFDALETTNEMEAYQAEHKAVVKVINDEESCDIDYPFQTRGYARILSKDGKIKVGNTLWIYKADRKISIINATETKVSNYADAVVSIEKNGIYVEHYVAPRSRRGQPAEHQVLSSKLDKDGKVWYYWSLDIYKQYTDKGLRTIMGLYQQAKKKKAGGHNVYKTTYSCCIDKLIVDNNPIYGNKINHNFTSSEERGGQYFKILICDVDKCPNFSITLTHRSRGCAASEPLKYSYSQAFNIGQYFEVEAEYSGA